MLTVIYEMAMTATVIMNMQETVLTLTDEWKIVLGYVLNTCKLMCSRF